MTVSFNPLYLVPSYVQLTRHETVQYWVSVLLAVYGAALLAASRM